LKSTPEAKLEPIFPKWNTMWSNSDLCRPWQILQCLAAKAAIKEPALATLLYRAVIRNSGFATGLGYLLGERLATSHVDQSELCKCVEACFQAKPLLAAAESDLKAAVERDPTQPSPLHVLLFYKGFLVLQAYRVMNALWREERRTLALFMQSRVSEVFGVDIHPAAVIGKGILLDHATGLVIGETAVVGDRVSLFHEVTLGGTGKETGERHPKVRDDVLIGTGARILGNVEIGRGARIGAGSVVLDDIPAFATAVGVPARVVAIHGNRVSTMPLPVDDAPSLTLPTIREPARARWLQAGV
jgi:serine O-acetyltransferase